MNDSKNLATDKSSSLGDAETTPKAQKPKSRERRHKLLYEAAYLELSPSLLSKEGKKIVAQDPNLSAKTLQKLLELQGGKLKDIQFNFGLTNWGESNDTGCALLSCCIKDNYNSTWAELVGRYADMRRKPFLETAYGLMAYHSQHGLAYYNDNQELVPWEPYILEGNDSDSQNSAIYDENEITGVEGLITDMDLYIKNKHLHFWE